MSAFDITPYLAPSTGPTPSGRDVEATGELQALDDATREPDEPGIKGQEAIDSRNWREIRRKAEGLLSESKHLRVACHLARALLHTDGLGAFCSCVGLISALVERDWEHLYPPLDGTDAIERLNILRELISPTMLGDIRGTPLLSLKGLGTFSLGDVLVAKGVLKPKAGSTPPSPQVVLAALENAAVADLKPNLEAAREGQKALRSLALKVSTVTGQPFEFAALSQLLQRVEELLGPHAEKPEAAPVAEPAAPGGAPGVSTPPPAKAAASPVPTGDVQSRQEVAQLLDKIVRYYERNEPSSPVPLLLQRAKRLATMNFMEIMKDLADKGLPQIEAVTGKETKS